MGKKRSVWWACPRLAKIAFAFSIAASFLLPPVLDAAVGGQSSAAKVRVWEDTLTLPTYAEGLPDPNPPFDFFNPRRFNYPYTIRTNLTDRREPKAWRTLNLENEFLKCIVLPDLGGHLYRCIDKINGADVFYANPSLKFAKIGYRGTWAAFGIEFNFPVSHNWMTSSPVDFAVTTGDDGSASVWIGNIDRVYGMHWRVALTLRPGRAVLEQHTTLYNRSDFRHRFYWWTNAAAEVWDDSHIIYPMEFTAAHGFRDIDTWPVDSSGADLSVVGNHKRGSVSRFSYGSREPYMAVYHPRTESGVVHYASPTDLPAKKIWSWGSDARGLSWRHALSDNNSAYVEIQAGLFRDQETYGFLEPQESVSFSEYWVPIRQIGGVSRANPEAVLHATRKAVSSALHVALNVTQALPDARIVVLENGQPVENRKVSLAPSSTFTAEYIGLTASAPYTIELRNAADDLVIAHTEGRYDFTPSSEIKVGPQQGYEYPTAAEQSEGDWISLGEELERNGKRLEALTHYREGLGRHPESLVLRKAAGRLGVDLKQYAAAADNLGATLHRVSNDYEASYYLGQALLAQGDMRKARFHWEQSQSYGTFRSASLFSLAALSARQGDWNDALEMIEQTVAETPDAVRIGGLEVALLRTLGRTEAARVRLEHWREVDPTSSFLRYESTLLGSAANDGLWRHLAGDPERILEIAVDYIRFGLWGDALGILERDYPSGPGVIGEPGAPSPGNYPLIAYYRGFCRQALERSGTDDFDAASRMSTHYVFPNRPESLAVLQAAVAHNPEDATAYFLLGSLYLAGGMADQAMDAWEKARSLEPKIPVLHRNMGYTVLHSGGSPQQAVELFLEGVSVDAMNAGLYFGLDEAMTRDGRPAGERADALLKYPDPQSMPSELVYKLIRTLAEAMRFDEADQLFFGRFFPREEGGTNVREVYLDVKVARARSLAKEGRCKEALHIIDRLSEEVSELPFTSDGLEGFIESSTLAPQIEEVRTICGDGRQ